MKSIVAQVRDAFAAVLALRIRKHTAGRVLLMAGLALVPTIYVAQQFDPEHGFTKLIDFGREFEASSLPKVRALSPARLSRWGSDGQFYAQIAMDPLLRDPAISTACDQPEYRARRIFLPALAWLAGLGQPATVLTAYALLNLAFWYVLLIVLAQSQKAETLSEWLCLGAIVWTNGILISIIRSFTDLPAATLMVIAAAVPITLKPIALACSVLTKETYAICSWCILVDGTGKRVRWWKIVGQLCLILGPLAAWVIYLHSRFHSHPEALSDYSWPMRGWWHAIVGTGHFWDGVAAASLLMQLLYLLLYRNFDSVFWRIGVTFGLAATVLSAEPFGEQTSFTRDLIPLTIGFNVMLMRQRRFFMPWLVVGNAGLFTTWMKIIRAIFGI